MQAREGSVPLGDQEVTRVAMVGAGNMAVEHLRAFRSMSSADVVGICSRTRSKLETVAGEWEIPIVVDSIAELYDQTQADLVVIAVSIPSMKSAIEHALQYPWVQLVEKPPGLDYLQARSLCEGVEKSGRSVLVGLNRRCYSTTQGVLREIHNTHGPRFVAVQDQESALSARDAGHDDLVVANWMYANSIHLIDYFSIFCRGEIEELTVSQPWRESETFVVLAHIQYSSGDFGLYQAVWNGPGPWSVSINADDLRWELRPLERGQRLEKNSRTPVEMEIHPWDENYKAGLRLQAEEAIRFVRSGECLCATLAEAMKTVELTSRIYGMKS